jgi:hypothetical protein
MVLTSPLSIQTPTTYYRGYRYFWHENGIKLPLRGEATKHFANEEEAKAYIDSLTAPPVSCSPVTSKTQETKPSSAVAPGVNVGGCRELDWWSARVADPSLSGLRVRSCVPPAASPRRGQLRNSPRALSAQSKNAPWPTTVLCSATTWHVTNSSNNSRALGIIAGAKVVTTMTMLWSAL